MGRGKRSSQKAPNDNPPESVALPYREQRANRAAERAAKAGKPLPPPPAAPTIQRPRRNIIEKTYSAKDGPVVLKRGAPIVDPEIPLLPGQEDIPPSPRDSSHVTTQNTQVTPDAETHSSDNLETSAEHVGHPFGQPEPQPNLNFGYGGEDLAILPNNQLDLSAPNWPSMANSRQSDTS
ncbi:hypothetical protein FRC08_009512 [Ceratobasidium sp. 394]|nr:hypothetical protein FRC08_009512 [Ceratobasidium sp. 394]